MRFRLGSEQVGIFDVGREREEENSWGLGIHRWARRKLDGFLLAVSGLGRLALTVSACGVLGFLVWFYLSYGGSFGIDINFWGGGGGG